ncbi:MAG: DUF971 domain-containing protein [Gemmatimonadetes bacterium]|nr:DUF971 domain-containing protein [Gemmatimonadota bacterium]
MTGAPVPQRIHRGGRQVVITWDADHVGTYDAQTLRLACHCAVCRDEVSGRPLLDPGRVPASVEAESIQLVGGYGIKIRWTDGHDTGIYTYEYLWELCPCGKHGR